MRWLLKSLGIKRYIAAVLTTVLTFAYSVPEASFLIGIVQQIAGFFGLTGVLHGIQASNVENKKTLTLAGAFAALLAAANYFPQLQHLLPILEKIAAVLSAFGLGAAVARKDVTDEQ